MKHRRVFRGESLPSQQPDSFAVVVSVVMEGGAPLENLHLFTIEMQEFLPSKPDQLVSSVDIQYLCPMGHNVN
jgi:hypothetical protein